MDTSHRTFLDRHDRQARVARRRLIPVVGPVGRTIDSPIFFLFASAFVLGSSRELE